MSIYNQPPDARSILNINILAGQSRGFISIHAHCHAAVMSLAELWIEGARQLPLAPLVVGAFVIPYIIAYLSFDPSTRWLRVGLWPLSVFCYAAGLGRVNEPCERPPDLVHCAVPPAADRCGQ